jgi:hypothetical protein
MIAQLFVVPGLIVAGAVAILLGFSWLAGGARTPEAFLDGLKNSNPEVRWRTASDLAQVLQRDDTLASDVYFGTQLVNRLQDALAEVAKPAPEKPSEKMEDKFRRSAAQDWHNYQIRRAEVQYLAACVGNLSAPIGAKVLGDMIRKPLSSDEKTDAILRRQAVWAIANLGNNRQRFDRLSEDRKQKVLAELDQHGAKAGDAADWARISAEILRNENSGGVIGAIARCAEADDPFLRKQSALALSFWKGTPAENETADTTLLRLTRDDGHGRSVEITEKD